MSVARTETIFRLDPAFVAAYASQRPDFGYDGLGAFVYYDKYSRTKPCTQHRDDGCEACPLPKEQWHETCERVINGTFTILKRHILLNDLPWSDEQGQCLAREAYDRMFAMKWLPPGRGLQVMGSRVLDKGLAAALNNCAFISTANLDADPTLPFRFMMDMSMLGVGVGFDTLGAGKLTLHLPTGEPEAFVVPDTREGWVESMELLLQSYFLPGRRPVQFDYAGVRPKGARIKTFGGTSSGPQPLRRMHAKMMELLDRKARSADPRIDARTITDLMNLIGRAVVSGNVRRSAQIAYGSPWDGDYVGLKDWRRPENEERMRYDKDNPERSGWGWTSNNSVLIPTLGTDYAALAERIRVNGEPGLLFLPNMKGNARMGEAKHDPAVATNPCAEMPLESGELCTLVEVFPARHATLQDFLRTLKFAYLYGKVVTLTSTHWPETNAIMKRNRRIGLSLTGLAQFLHREGLATLATWCREGYAFIQDLDEEYSGWMAVPRSIRMTTVKPSGTVSLVAGATPGMHFLESRYHVRRVRAPNGSALAQAAAEAGYHVEPSVEDPEADVVEFPIDAGEGRYAHEVSMWEQLQLAALLQEVWSDNAVSCTVTFHPETEGKDIARALDYFQYRLKTISFLPRVHGGAYPQMPYEAITKERYDELRARIRGEIRLAHGALGKRETGCDGDRCVL